jgi:hypothetical protein
MRASVAEIFISLESSHKALPATLMGVKECNDRCAADRCIHAEQENKTGASHFLATPLISSENRGFFSEENARNFRISSGIRKECPKSEMRPNKTHRQNSD